MSRAATPTSWSSAALPTSSARPGPDGILGTADDVHKFTNQTSPFVDQGQTYASDPSHQVFLRDYMIGIDGHLHSSGALLGQAKANGTDGMANWGELKAQAATKFGILLTGADVGNVPLLATDDYGNSSTPSTTACLRRSRPRCRPSSMPATAALQATGCWPAQT